MYRSRAFVTLAAASTLALTPASTLFAFDAADEEYELDRSIYFSINGGFEHQFRTDLRRGGAFDVSRGWVGFGVRTEVTDDTSITARFNYNLHKYDFRSGGNFGSDPWDDIHTMNFGAIITTALNNEWSLFGGPVFQFARESGASWSDSFIGGGFIGARYEFNDDLTIGGGVGVVSQFDTSPRVFPIIVLDWHINDEFRITSTTAASASGESGIEAVYTVGGGWEAAIGVANRFSRFRLDNGGIAPDGIGQDYSIPLWGRITHHFGPQFSLNLYGGASLGGHLRLEDSDENRVARDSYDAAPFVGVSGSLRF